jgi:purine-binding chemotaxis protein CheW
MPKELQIVGFRVGRETFGIPIAQVHEIVRVPEITAVPNAPEFVEGVMNLRGKIVPVVDIRKRFGEQVPQPSNRNRVVVAEVDRKLVGLIVDTASEVLKIPSSQVEPAPSVFQEAELTYVTGMGKLRDRLIILIDLSKVLQHGELRPVTNGAAKPAVQA